MKIFQAVVALFIKDGLVLGISRKDNHQLFGLIGGKVEDNELLYDALCREVLEEVGVNVLDAEFLHQRIEHSLDVQYLTSCYLIKKWEGEPVSCEGTKVEWLTKKELTETKAAYPDYNKKTFEILLEKYPEIYLC